ncbi:AraC family transcriptional regulator [Magnetospirillum aberrantis]|uniref:AraC family transcriptional regulator n=1 Tax=Magnetospirillum aberrantis SpK TaxID=908842 RepID=A0A7C9UUQ7_9PROT|nr:AraC family transcriptional regulator [Magnetospirillum aberrantis]NFV79469.1 AraC family transcriptional regulator [Magnetospirillum aberrantis SpK]
MATAEPMVISSLLQHVVDGVRERRLDPAPLLRRHHIPQSWLLDPYGEVPLRKYVEIMEEAAQLASSPDFGLQLARGVTPFNLGPVGLLFASSADLGRSLYGLAAHVGVVQERTTCDLTPGEETAIFRYRIEDERIRGKRHEAEYTLGVTCQLIRSIAGNRWDPEEVHFEHPAPAATHAHAALFRAPVYFDQPINAIIMRCRDLEIRNPQTDERMASFFLHHVAMMRRHRGDRQLLTDQVRSIVRNHLPSTDGVVNAEQAAKATGLSARSMQRALQKESTGFRAIKDAERKSLAQQYLSQTGTPITEVALMLGYADPACFTRACRRWFGASPRRVRQGAMGG